MRNTDITSVTMTILPGHPLVPADAPSPEPPRPPRGPRLDVSRRTLALALAAVTAVGGGGAWFALRSSGGSAPVAATSPVPAHHPAHHPAPAGQAPARLAPPHTPAAAMRAANKVFPVIAAQLPGWKVDGKATFEASSANDPVSTSVDKCLGTSNAGIGVESPDVTRTSSAPTNMSVGAVLTFMRTPRAAAADLAVIRSPRAQRCISAAVVGRTVSLGATASMRFTSMRPLKVSSHGFGFEFDGRLDSSVFGAQPVRVVMLGAVDSSTEILVTSSGLGAALPLSTDVRVLNAVVAQTHRVVA